MVVAAEAVAGADGVGRGAGGARVLDVVVLVLGIGCTALGAADAEGLLRVGFRGEGPGVARPFVAAAGCEVATGAALAWKSGANMGRSGCSVVAFVSSVTRRPCGRLPKYRCRYANRQ